MVKFFVRPATLVAGIYLLLLIAAILAATNPARDRSLYFVADGQGGHAFAQSLTEHNRNVERWRQIQRERQEQAQQQQQQAPSGTPGSPAAPLPAPPQPVRPAARP